MQGMARTVIVTAAGLISVFLGGLIGFLATRALVEGMELVSGPPATVLLVLLVTSCALVGGVFGSTLTFRWLTKRREK